MRSRVYSTLRGLLVASFLLSAEALPAVPQELHEFQITAVDAVSAIQQFAEQAGVHILADGEKLKGVRLNAVSGRLSLDEGLRRMLAGTGLTYKHVGERAIALIPATRPASRR